MKNRIKILEKLSDIKDLKYEGYLWWSDEPSPQLSGFTFSDKIDDRFIVEGFLYSEEDETSVAIRHIDGTFIISEIDLAGINVDSANTTKHTYLADAAISKQNDNYKYLNFIEYWEKEPDDLCEDMEVLKPTWVAFTGYSTNKEKKDDKSTV